MENLEQQAYVRGGSRVMAVITTISAIVAICSLLVVFMWWKDLIYLKEEVHTLSYKASKAEQALSLQDMFRKVADLVSPRVVGAVNTIDEGSIVLGIKVATFIEKPKPGESPFIQSTKTIKLIINEETIFSPEKETFKEGDMVTVLTAEEVAPDATIATAKFVTMFVPVPVNEPNNPVAPPSSTNIPTKK